ncbi:hypothetical protein HHK36_029975 [Tetracentron sinense]|uniref:DRBM domain-containing protein n=1 Tax=Tetracentron sinense TaxID=13715 RepID=A0A835D284_TETSI|nr:hypothetical protein HHK36_029975 [Tetracentron sinense]
MYKNRLQEYAQRSSIPLPIYQTINEGFPHAPKFRSTVLVDGAAYKSINTFSQRKAAEQDVAKRALECISKKIKDEGCPLVSEDKIFCKSIINEFAVKMNLEKPTYTTTRSEGLLPIFISSLVFDGKTYTGGACRNKKEAEQLAARTVIQTILSNSLSGTLLSEIIKSKVKLYGAVHNVKDFGFAHDSNVLFGVNPGNSSGISTSRGKEVEVTLGTYKLPITACSNAPSGPLINVPITHPSLHEYKKPRLELLCDTSSGPVGNVTSDQLSGGGSVGQFGWASELVSDAHHVQQNQMQKEVALVHPSGVIYYSHGTAFNPNIGRNRSRKNKKKKQKKMLSGEQAIGLVSLDLNRAWNRRTVKMEVIRSSSELAGDIAEKMIGNNELAGDIIGLIGTVSFSADREKGDDSAVAGMIMDDEEPDLQTDRERDQDASRSLLARSS